MFDIGFLEIIVILVITLLVIGPERMPEVARKIGQFMGKTKRFINSMKENSEITETVREIQQSMNLEEEKKHIESVTGSLQDDFTHIREEFGIDEDIARPTFGGEEPPAAVGNQFNKAPAQPLPAKESASATTQPANTAEPKDVAPTEAKPDDTNNKSAEKP